MAALHQIHTVKTRKPHRCETCHTEIPAGTQINAESLPYGAVYMEGIRTAYYCRGCKP